MSLNTQPISIQFQASLERAAQAYESSTCANTQRARDSVYRGFRQWTIDMGLSWENAQPISIEVIAAYIGHLLQKKMARSTIEQHVAALRFWHLSQDLPNPFSDVRIRALIQGAKKQSRVKQGKSELTPELIARGLAQGDFSTLERTLILVNFITGLRVGEICALQKKHVEFRSEGVLITIPQSKTDQNANGQIVTVPAQEQAGEQCPTKLLEKLIQENPSPFVFGPKYTDPRKVRLLVKRLIQAAGEDPSNYSSHSFRIGVATTSYRQNAPILDIRDILRHKQLETTVGYVRGIQAFQNVAQRLATQNLLHAVLG